MKSLRKIIIGLLFIAGFTAITGCKHPSSGGSGAPVYSHVVVFRLDSLGINSDQTWYFKEEEEIFIPYVDESCHRKVTDEYPDQIFDAYMYGSSNTKYYFDIYITDINSYEYEVDFYISGEDRGKVVSQRFNEIDVNSVIFDDIIGWTYKFEFDSTQVYPTEGLKKTWYLRNVKQRGTDNNSIFGVNEFRSFDVYTDSDCKNKVTEFNNCLGAFVYSNPNNAEALYLLINYTKGSKNYIFNLSGLPDENDRIYEYGSNGQGMQANSVKLNGKEYKYKSVN